jgi:hypothetical protein
MTLAEFKNSLSEGAPPPGISKALEALWHDAKGNWEVAHPLVQNPLDQKACWVHGFLHREDGDLGNAGYWYSRAGKAVPNLSIQQEWDQIVSEFLL